MIKKDKVYRENEAIVHVGEWDFKEDGEPVPFNPEWVESTEEVETMPDGSRIAVNDHAQRREYPPTGDQLDYIYHHGVEAWKKDLIEPVKLKNKKKYKP